MFEYKKNDEYQKKSIAIFIQFEIRCRNQRKVSGLAEKIHFVDHLQIFMSHGCNGCSSVFLCCMTRSTKILASNSGLSGTLSNIFGFMDFIAFKACSMLGRSCGRNFAAISLSPVKKRKQNGYNHIKKYRVHVHYNLSYK